MILGAEPQQQAAARAARAARSNGRARLLRADQRSASSARSTSITGRTIARRRENRPGPARRPSPGRRCAGFRAGGRPRSRLRSRAGTSSGPEIRVEQRNVVDRVPGLQLVEEPEPPLREGERAAAGRRVARTIGGGPVCLAGLDAALGQARPGWEPRRRRAAAARPRDRRAAARSAGRRAANDRPARRNRRGRPASRSPAARGTETARRSSIWVRGSTWSRRPTLSRSGSGRASRSILPLGLSGKVSRSDHRGRHHVRRAAARRGSSAARHGRHRPLRQLRYRPRSASRRRRPCARRRGPGGPQGWAESAASISPGSMRKPRILT